MQGPSPSFKHMIFPQLRQLGAARRRGWRVALQLQGSRVEGKEEEEEDLVGLVWSSRARMAESYKLCQCIIDGGEPGARQMYQIFKCGTCALTGRTTLNCDFCLLWCRAASPRTRLKALACCLSFDVGEMVRYQVACCRRGKFAPCSLLRELLSCWRVGEGEGRSYCVRACLVLARSRGVTVLVLVMMLLVASTHVALAIDRS